MELPASQETRFEVTVIAHRSLLQQLQVLGGGLVIFGIVVIAVIARSTAPMWLVITVTLALIVGLLAFYKLAKGRMFARSGFDLVRAELDRTRLSPIRLISLDGDNHTIVARRLDDYRKVTGTLRLIKAEYDWSYLTYHIDLLPE